jgi:hypothetical protein
MSELTAMDRCDRCSAAARVIVTMGKGELFFCGHHAKDFKATIFKQGFSVYDPDDFLELRESELI